MGKKLVSLLVIGILVVHLAGFYIYFVVRLGEIRMTMREQLAQLPVEQLEIVLVPYEKFRSSWIEEREMKWQGKMYDIARVEQKGGLVVVYCMHDSDEDSLLSFLDAVIDMSQQDTQPTPSTVIQFFALKFVAAKLFCPEPSAETLELNPTAYRASFQSVEVLPLTPPPQG